MQPGAVDLANPYASTAYRQRGHRFVWGHCSVEPCRTRTHGAMSRGMHVMRKCPAVPSGRFTLRQPHSYSTVHTVTTSALVGMITTLRPPQGSKHMRWALSTQRPPSPTSCALSDPVTCLPSRGRAVRPPGLQDHAADSRCSNHAVTVHSVTFHAPGLNTTPSAGLQEHALGCLRHVLRRHTPAGRAGGWGAA